jgi:hypothetical protein
VQTALEVAQEHYGQQSELIEATAEAGLALWSQVNPADLTASWAGFLARLLVILRGAQVAAATPADSYVGEALAAQGLRPSSTGRVVPEALSGVASDGRPLETLLLNPVIAAKQAIRSGADVPRAMATGHASLEMLLRTQVADAGRVADGVALTARSKAGYTRMLVPPGDCSRCVILAGKWYRYNDGFDRHPQCNCIHIPAPEDADDLRTDPKAFFESLSEPEQDRIFTKTGAQAIRDGADMNQIVNARRGAAGLAPAGARITAEEKAAIGFGRLRRTTVYGQEVFITSEGTTRRGIAGKRLIAAGGVRIESAETVTRQSRSGGVQRTVRRGRAKAPRLMPESIYELATDRDDAIRLLRRFGYIV